jgi:transcriptional regulator with XRE-family HTH domain
MTIKRMRTKRIAAAISGNSLCRKIGWGRTKLANVESGYLSATAEELQQLETALNQLSKNELRH